MAREGLQGILRWGEGSLEFPLKGADQRRDEVFSLTLTCNFQHNFFTSWMLGKRKPYITTLSFCMYLYVTVHVEAPGTPQKGIGRTNTTGYLAQGGMCRTNLAS